MSFVFPFAGARGGFFHSAAALQPMLWAAVPVGLDAFLRFGNRKRGWDTAQARRFFQPSLVILALLISGLALQRRVIGNDWQAPIWDQPAQQQAASMSLLREADAQDGEIVMVNNPPGYTLAGGGPAIVIPDGDVSTLLAAGRRFGARYVILEVNHPPGLDELYAHPGNITGLRHLLSRAGAHLFEIIPATEAGSGS
jgi:hypothetical protein